MIAQPSADPIAVGPFVMDLVNHRLLRDSIEIKLRHQALRVLEALVARCGQNVSYDEMIRNAWGGVSVSRHTLEVTVGEVKKALGEYGSWIVRRPKLGYRLEVPQSDELIRCGWHFLGHRTREAFEKALSCFERAAGQNSADFRAFEGLAQSYLIIGVYGMRAPREMRRGFVNAHEKAVSLVGWTPELRCAHGHALHMFEWKYEDAERELLRVLREKPNLVQAYARLAMLYVTVGRLEEALGILRRGESIDPLYPAFAATEVFLRFCRREFDIAVECGKKAVELHPYLELSHTFYARALEHSGRPAEALAQYGAARAIFHSTHRLWLLEAQCMAKNGRRRKALQVLEEARSLRATEYVDAYHLAVLLDALGRTGEALEELERAIEESSAALYMLDVDPDMDSLREQPLFAQLRARMHSRKATRGGHLAA